MEDFICLVCGDGLPSFPVHGSNDTYCSAYCRDWIEGAPVNDTIEEED
jgi:hypothetical protein